MLHIYRYTKVAKMLQRKENNIMTENKMYFTASELAEILGISVGHAYKIIRRLNDELQKEGYIVIAGKVPKRYVEKRCFGFSA